MRAADELRDAVEAYLGTLSFAEELGGLEAALRYSLESGGKRVRPVLCLAVAEAGGGSVERALPAAAALELVHTFSLVHDDLPSMDDDAVRRGRPSAHVAFGEAVALLAGDALLTEALRLALTYESGDVARDLVDGTLGMIAGQYRDVTGDDADRWGRFARERGLRIRNRHVVAPQPDDHAQPGCFAMDLVRGGSLGQLLQRVGQLVVIECRCHFRSPLA